MTGEFAELGVHAVAEQVRAGRIRADVVLGAAFDAIDGGRAAGLNAFVAAHDGPRAALAAAGRAGGATAEGRKHARGKGGGPLAGVPVAVGDDVGDLALPTTAGSRVLAGYVSPYEATAVARLLDAGAVVVGKTNVDEFGMGWGTETSAYGPTTNPAARAHTPGGSAGGAAAAVASGAVRAALGGDAGGGLRQAAAACGVVAIRPTFGRVSRSGLVAVASSLDQVGVCARTVDDAAALLEVVAGRDPRDATTADLEVDRLRPPGGPFEDGRPLRGVRIGRPRQYFGDDVTPAVRAAVDAAIALARDLGAHVEDVSLEHSELALPAYHAVAAVEAASNLARYDGVRFGATSGAAGARAVYDGARAGFGPEVVRRVTLGTHLLSRADRAGSYRRAQEARARIARDLADALGDVDLLVTPTTPAAAPAAGDVDADAALRQDAFTVGPSLAGLPAVTIPVGRVGGVPVGAQLVGRHFGEQLLLRAAAALERAVGPEVRA